jgi:hypothetical protein
MKKYYVAPELEELEMELEGFLCGSKDIADGDPVDMGGENNDEDDGL